MKEDEYLMRASQMYGQSNWLENLEEIVINYINAYRSGSAQGALGLAQLYEERLTCVGQGKIVYWLEKACEMGDALACARLSIAYLSGELGLDKNTKRADDYSRRAAEIEKKQ